MVGTTKGLGRARAPILYVDDEDPNLTVFEAAFEDYYSVLTASSARQALEILRREDVHLVIADQRMPEMTGVQLLEALIEECPDTIRIILTGYVDVEDTIKAINAGRVYRYITKPWNERELKIIIDRALESYELRKRQRRLLEDLQRQAVRETEIRQTFQRYVPATVVDELLDPRNQGRFLGEERIVAILRSDIRGFSDLRSRLAPTELVGFLNRYFSVMGSIVARHRGSVHRFLGDASVAVFGAPVSSLDNPENAVLAALEMLGKLKDFTEREAEVLGGETIKICIGIHSGEVVAGNIGSEVKMEYSVIGHAVTLAEQIHQLSKTRPNSILISESVYKWSGELIAAEPLEPVILRGETEPMLLYRIQLPAPTV